MDIQSGEDVFLFLLLFFQSPGIIDAYGLTINGYLYFVTALKRNFKRKSDCLFVNRQVCMWDLIRLYILTHFIVISAS